MKQNKTVGVVLSGCGYLDGSEVHEAVLTLLHLDRAGVEVACFAPRGAQRHVVDHLTGEPVAGATRDVLQEAARIARGRIRELGKARAEDLDALILPGGYGAAKNLSDFATRGAEGEANPVLTRLLRAMHAAGKPIGVICIAPAVLAMALRGSSVPAKLTIGDDAGTASALGAMGCVHEACGVIDFVVDTANKIVSTPAYMFDARISDVSSGIEKLVGAVLELAR